MGALVNQNHAKKLFGARLVEKIIQKAIRSQEIFFNTTQTKMDALVTSNFAKKLFGARWLTFRKNGYVPEKSFFNGKNFQNRYFRFKIRFEPF